MRRTLSIVTTLATVLFAVLAPPALAGPPHRTDDLTGYCLPGDECTGDVAFRGMTVDLCEETCTLSRPVAVLNMDATLYDFTCHGDHIPGGSERRRAMIYASWEGVHLLMPGAPAGQPITPCR